MPGLFSKQENRRWLALVVCFALGFTFVSDVVAKQRGKTKVVLIRARPSQP